MADIKSPCIKDIKALVPPQPGQYIPNMNLNIQPFGRLNLAIWDIRLTRPTTDSMVNATIKPIRYRIASGSFWCNNRIKVFFFFILKCYHKKQFLAISTRDI